MLAEIDDRSLILDLTEIAYRTFHDKNGSIHNKIHLFWNEDLHDRILTDSQLNSSIERLLNVFTLYARVISIKIREKHIQYVEFKIKKKRGQFLKKCILYVDNNQISRFIDGIEKILDSFDHSDLHNFIFMYFSGYYSDFIHFIVIQFLLAHETFRNQHFNSR